MEIIVTSDCHSRSEVLKQIYQRHPHADFYLDAGDSECLESQISPFLTVKGNCDYNVQEKFRIVDAGPVKIYLFHGNSIPLSVESLARLAKANGCSMIIHGHTHIPLHLVHNGIHILCPGSVTLPRSTKGRTYCSVRIGENSVEEVSFYKVPVS